MTPNDMKKKKNKKNKKQKTNLFFCSKKLWSKRRKEKQKQTNSKIDFKQQNKHKTINWTKKKQHYWSHSIHNWSTLYNNTILLTYIYLFIYYDEFSSCSIACGAAFSSEERFFLNSSSLRVFVLVT